MISALSITSTAGTTNLMTADRGIKAIAGITGATTPRRNSWPRAYDDGDAIIQRGQLGGRTITIVGFCKGSDPWAEWDAVQDALLAAHDENAALLKWTRSDGRALQAYVRLASGIDDPIETEPGILRYQVTLLAIDPRLYSQSDATASRTGTGTVSCTNDGRVGTWPVIDITGPITSPIVSWSGGYISFPGLTVAAGTTLRIYTRPDIRAMSVAGVSKRSSLDPATAIFAPLPAGTTVVTLAGSGTTGATAISMSWRHAYMT